MDFVKRTWAEISLDAIMHNFNEIKKKVGNGPKICCVIKADGYGHGAEELSGIYEKLGADFFAVSNIDEGIEIRSSGVSRSTTPRRFPHSAPSTAASAKSISSATRA